MNFFIALLVALACHHPAKHSAPANTHPTVCPINTGGNSQPPARPSNTGGGDDSGGDGGHTPPGPR